MGSHQDRFLRLWDIRPMSEFDVAHREKRSASHAPSCCTLFLLCARCGGPCDQARTAPAAATAAPPEHDGRPVVACELPSISQIVAGPDIGIP